MVTSMVYYSNVSKTSFLLLNPHLMIKACVFVLSSNLRLVQSMESLKGVKVEIRPYGSFSSHLYTKWGDLDVSVELNHHSFISSGRQCKIIVLRRIMNVLWRKGVARNFNFIPRARVPVLRYESRCQNVSCDVSIDNHLGVMKSRILFLISEIDERFRDLVLLVVYLHITTLLFICLLKNIFYMWGFCMQIKEWANAHNINDPKSGTLNSYSLCLLVIFHFQTCKPAILPPLKDIYGRNFDDLSAYHHKDVYGRYPIPSIEREREDACIANIAKFKSSRQRNGDNLAQLFIDFFDMFSAIERISSDFAICTYTGRWEKIISNSRWMEKSYSLLIEDPFDRPDNTARTVGSQELCMISEAFKKTSRKLSKSSVLSSRNALLDNLVRPNVRSELEETVGFIGI